ncbi:MAG: hypothetical protein AABY93_16460 [Bacteroidota bacterium]
MKEYTFRIVIFIGNKTYDYSFESKAFTVRVSLNNENEYCLQYKVDDESSQNNALYSLVLEVLKKVLDIVPTWVSVKGLEQIAKHIYYEIVQKNVIKLTLITESITDMDKYLISIPRISSKVRGRSK